MKKTRSMTQLVLVLLFVDAMACTFSWAQSEPEAKQLAEKSAENWLALVDSGNYAESWQQASSLFRSQVSQSTWESKVGPVRQPLGEVLSRKLKNASYTTSLPGAPDGEYEVIQYETSFAHKKSAVETVTPMLDKDGRWRVSGYFIR